MIEGDYNGKFRNFFKKFEKRYRVSDEGDRNDLFDLAVDFVERNRDFVMQYPLVQYWNETERGAQYDATKERLLKKYTGKNVNLYFHIPFCKTKCTYCNFHIVVGERNKTLQEAMYIHKLKQEIDEFLVYSADFTIDTLFIG